MKTIKINGIKIYVKEEDLNKQLKDLIEPEYEIETDWGGYIKINGKEFASLVGETSFYNYSTISREIAEAMNDLLETKDVLDKNVIGYYVYFDIYDQMWVYNGVYGSTYSKHFKTKEKAELAAKLLNEYNRDNPIFGHKIGEIDE